MRLKTEQTLNTLNNTGVTKLCNNLLNKVNIGLF